MEFMKKIEKHLVPILISWLFFIVILVFLYKLPCNLNEWGDFLAGITSPVALLLLVMGYFQQKEELKLNTSELAKQAEQLAKQTEILEFQQLSLKGPDLYFRKEIIDDEECITITNKGAMAVSIRLNGNGFSVDDDFDEWFIPALKFDESTSISVVKINTSNNARGLHYSFNSRCFYVMFKSLQKTEYRIQVTLLNTNEYAQELCGIDP